MILGQSALQYILFNPILTLSATFFRDWLLFPNSFTYDNDTSWLLLNTKNENFEQNLNLNYLPQPPRKGVLKIWFFFSFVLEPKLLYSICRTHKERTKAIIWALYLKNCSNYGDFLRSRQYLIEILRYGSDFLHVIITFIGFKITFLTLSQTLGLKELSQFRSY